MFLDDRGADLSQAAQRKLERVFARAGVPAGVPRRDRRPLLPAARDRGLRPRAAAPGRHHRRRRGRPRRSSSTPAAAPPRWCCRRCSAGSASTRSPSTTASTSARRPRPAPSAAEALHRLGELVASSRADFGVRFDPVGERHLPRRRARACSIDDERALLVVLDLVAAERAKRHGRAAGHHDPGRRAGRRVPRRRDPVDVDVAGRPDPGRRATRTSSSAATAAAASSSRSSAPRSTGSRRSSGSSGWSRAPSCTLSQIDARIPQAHVVRAVGRRRRGRPRAWSCAPSSRRPATARSTRPTACAWSRPTAAGRWCCPTRPSRSPTSGPRRPTTPPRTRCSTGGPPWWSAPDR